MFANQEHITQFLWTSALFASYLVRARRVDEGYAIISPASHLAVACGLLSCHNPESEPDYRPDQFLLPPPVTETEALERIWLGHSVFIADHSLSVLTGLPTSFTCDGRWIPSMDNFEITYPWFKMPMARDEEVSKIWQSDVHRNIPVTHLFVEVTVFALSFHISITQRVDQSDTKLSSSSSSPSFASMMLEFLLSQTRSLTRTLMSFSLMQRYTGAQLFFTVSMLGKMQNARSEMLRAVQKLVDICKQLRVHKHLYNLQASLMPMTHMMNAIRIFAHELKRFDAEENPTISTEYCHSIEVLLDFLTGMTTVYPAWKDSPELIKDTLNSAMESLKL
ncbi:hypothetical protein DL93DRAFT_1561684 [Clavulina sp. PMI_390]|nr:hypothetical protein DL93DRAFT_1561684 [Clavulina sp. PMI_390]